MQGSWNAGQEQQYRQQGQYAAAPPRKSRLGKFLLIALGVLALFGVVAGFAVYYGYRYVESSLKTRTPTARPSMN
jgi:type VI protein secretion system component VasF